MQDYLKGRDKQYPKDFTEEIVKHATVVLERANALLGAASLVRGCNSGWRPYTVQMEVNPRAPNSKHVTGDAIDIEDKDGKLKEWIKQNPSILDKLDLYMEHPDSTPTWVHVQIVPPRSKSRVFRP